MCIQSPGMQRSSSPPAWGIVFLAIILSCFTSLILPFTAASQNHQYEIVVLNGKVEKSIEYLKERNFWGKGNHTRDLDVPRIILAVASKRWHKESLKIPVADKKELFYRVVLPLVLLANELIEKERQEILEISSKLNNTKELSMEEEARLRFLAQQYGVQDLVPRKQQLAVLLERVDVIPPSLALGQTAYESGYGTSRFAIEGNALFGQWTFKGDGMRPKEYRASKGNYGVASYDWPFDSVRSYMKNLNTHNAYQPLRNRRSSLRKQNLTVTGPALAETLAKYSEKGMEYVNTLQSIIRVNQLTIADRAFLRDEPTTLLVGVEGANSVQEKEEEIERLRHSGHLAKIIEEMRLESNH